ncbi:unnamed protein product [Mucor fragilis]
MDSFLLLSPNNLRTELRYSMLDVGLVVGPWTWLYCIKTPSFMELTFWIRNFHNRTLINLQTHDFSKVTWSIIFHTKTALLILHINVYCPLHLQENNGEEI